MTHHIENGAYTSFWMEVHVVSTRVNRMGKIREAKVMMQSPAYRERFYRLWFRCRWPSYMSTPRIRRLRKWWAFPQSRADLQKYRAALIAATNGKRGA